MSHATAGWVAELHPEARDAFAAMVEHEPERLAAEQRRGITHPTLGARLYSLGYDYVTRVGTLYLAPGNSADMTATILYFLALDPEVREIRTMACGKPDTTYRREPRT